MASSVILTWFVVGLATTHSMGNFLTERMKDRFPSTLTTTTTRLRLWHERQRADLARVAADDELRELMAQLDAAGDAGRAPLLAAMEHRLDAAAKACPAFEDLLLLSPEGTLIASLDGTSSEVIDNAWMELGEREFEPGMSRPVPDARGSHQWVFTTVGEGGADPAGRAWMAGRVNLALLGSLLREVKIGPNGDIFLLDGQGRFLTAPRLSADAVVGTQAMQVPTRQNGPVIVERRGNYRGRSVFHSKVHLEELGCWLVYEEDYDKAMAQVIEAQRQGGQSGWAWWENGRLVALTAAEEGEFVTFSIPVTGRELRINARTPRAGIVKVGFGGRKIEDCDPIVGDNLAHPVSWKGNANVGIERGKTVSIKFHLRRAKLFGFEWVE